MIDYQTNFAETNGAGFPNTLGKNATGAGATDGTEFVKLFIDDIWGRFQAIMDYAGLSPDNVSEAPGTAQHLDALALGFGGPGDWVIWTHASTPSVTGHRVLFLNGQGVLRANYPLLDAEVYVGDPNNAAASAFYHADDAAGTIRNTAGVYLILPETRGYALRGLDTAAAVDPGGASRDYGNIQADAMQRITGSTGPGAGVRGSSTGIGAISVSAVSVGNLYTSGASSSFEMNFDSANSVSPNAAKTDDVETRMANVAVQFGIRY